MDKGQRRTEDLNVWTDATRAHVLGDIGRRGSGRGVVDGADEGGTFGSVAG